MAQRDQSKSDVRRLIEVLDVPHHHARISALSCLLNRRGFASELPNRARKDSACVAVTNQPHWFDRPIADRRGRRLWVYLEKSRSVSVASVKGPQFATLRTFTFRRPLGGRYQSCETSVSCPTRTNLAGHKQSSRTYLIFAHLPPIFALTDNLTTAF